MLAGKHRMHAHSVQTSSQIRSQQLHSDTPSCYSHESYVGTLTQMCHLVCFRTHFSCNCITRKETLQWHAHLLARVIYYYFFLGTHTHAHAGKTHSSTDVVPAH